MKKKTAKETEEQMVKAIYDFFDGPRPMWTMEIELKNHFTEIMQLLVRIGKKITDDDSFKTQEGLIGKILIKTAVTQDLLNGFFAPFKEYSIIADKKKLRTRFQK